jgi:photosystem II stability/assembly factor-like uncharacterized protein
MKHILLLLLLSCSLGSAQWQHVPEIPGIRTVYSLLSVHDTLYVGTDSLVYVGANAGTQWFSGVQPAASHDPIACILKTNNVLVAGTFDNGIFKSTNDGFSWQSFSAGLSGLGSMDISSLLVRRDSLIAGTLGAGVFIAGSDFTHSWTSWGDSIANYQGDNVFTMLAVGNTVLAGAGSNGYMFRYTDAQPWWNPIPINTPRSVGQSVWGMASSATTVVAGTNKGIYRSTDDGVSWERTSASIPQFTFTIHPAYYQTTFFAVTTTPLSSSLLKSSDEGRTWESLGVFPIPNVLDIAIVGETMYLGGAGGLWRAPLSLLLADVSEAAVTPLSFRLEQNYPNPFNPSTTISYSLPHFSFVTLTVYNALGQHVAQLVNEQQQTGYHDVVFRGDGLASGVYVYRIQAGDLMASKKLLLLK